MKYTVMMVFVGFAGFFASAAAQAQLTGTLNGVVSPVRPIIDRTPSELKALREEANRTVQSRVEGASSLNTLASDAVNRISSPQFVAPSATTILSTLGQPVVNEVVVENGFLAVEKEWLFLGEEADKAYFQHANIEMLSAQYLPALSQWLFKVKVSGEADEVSFIRNSLPENLQSQIGRNHIYLSQNEQVTETLDGKAANLISDNTASAAFKTCPTPLRVGMIDTHVAPNHPMLSHIELTQKSFIVGLESDKSTSQEHTDSAEKLGNMRSERRKDSVAFSSVHGTAVASLLAASIPNTSQVFNASVFYTRNSVSQGATLMSLIEGINYLASQQVDAINMSLAGPHNPVLARVISQLDNNGIQIIAAVGNEGPASLPLYPAAYPETLGVTAVDESHAIYRWANQGDYVDFAALGVSIDAAHPDGNTVRQTGTSMASPRVTALYACFFREEKERHSALLKLQELAVDAGNPGRDSVFGFGVLP